jgi:guanosine-3',5'-bis(diphosphate) 3'-pyrophosphohydrolase
MALERVLEKVSEESPKNLQELLERVSAFATNTSKEVITQAFEFGEKAHQGQVRRSGEPYFTHPIGVAGILCDLGLDQSSIIAGLLHDTVEDTIVKLEDIEKLFGKDVAELVDGVTKIGQMEFKNTHEKQGENIRKMIIAMGKDIRVILVKLADRLHNMRTLSHMPYHKQERIAQETLDIYAPLANRLGISSIKTELEDLSFRYLRPDIYYDLVQKVQKKKNEREKYVYTVIAEIKGYLDKAEIKADIEGRSKHFFSIYKKMEGKDLEFDQIFDLLGFRILTNNVSDCYQALGIVHSVWKPVPGRFKDYIALAKSNNYQSLHTTVLGPDAEQIEIQIRTHEMHLIAERGIAAHWKYKEKGKVDINSEKKFTWLRDMLSQANQDAGEYLESIKTDLFEAEIYVFTPAGDVRELPEGSTPVDFAYAVHSDVGHRCTGAKVNGKIVPLKHKLKSGDKVEILTSPTQTPNKDWLKFVITSKAKGKIRAHVRIEERARSMELGKEIVDRELRRIGQGPKLFKTQEFEKFMKKIGVNSLDEFYITVGYGKTSMDSMFDNVIPEWRKQEPVPEAESFIGKVFKSAGSKKKDSIITVDGMSDVLVRYAKCCTPIPGDPIMGFISRGRGVTVHNASCDKVFEIDNKRQVEVSWTKESKGWAHAQLRIVSLDKPGLLFKISEAFTLANANILSAKVRTTKDQKAVYNFEVNVRDLQHLSLVIQKIQTVNGIIGVERV